MFLSRISMVTCIYFREMILFISLETAQGLLGYDANTITDIELKTVDGVDEDVFRKELNTIFENNIIKTDIPAALDNDNMFLVSGFVGNNITIKNNNLIGATKSIVLNAAAPRTLWKINNNNA